MDYYCYYYRSYSIIIVLLLGRVKEGEELVFGSNSNQNLDYEHREQFDQVRNLS